MSSLRGRRDPRTGRVFGFQSETQRHNFMIGRARFCDGPNRLMPTCTAVTRSGEPCKAARMRGRSTCFRHGGSPKAKKTRLTAAYFSGDADRIQRAEMRLERNRLCMLWSHDPSRPGKTIVLMPDDEEICRAWASQQDFRLDTLDQDLPAFSDALRWLWARKSRGLVSEEDMTAKLARLRNRILEASVALDHSR
ncbi:hypothetical protein IQ16_02929 [Bradyrhizobium huanghuaihaiense]|uniref:Uncharacterized protein n=1 Tax=Bradyrhizobium huanghuaihaiense TaxID=990078 RepID=A0A562RSF3_9BRAD|nr:hypothetical protein IQ16_02929 [Bradyrhizobium huanghuaihaiense]